MKKNYIYLGLIISLFMFGGMASAEDSVNSTDNSETSQENVADSDQSKAQKESDVHALKNTLNWTKSDIAVEPASLKDPGDPHHGSKTWLYPSPSVQLERDVQLSPVMKGGIFVPTMTGGVVEPKYQVLDEDGTIIDEGFMGSTIYVPAGDYVVTVGSAASGGHLEFDTHVIEGSTTVIPVEWSGLSIKVVNDHGATIRGNYEIVGLPDRGYVGLGSGALINEGERLTTWILWPGKYMIISAGEGYQARKNFITVTLAPGELSRVTLVLDEDTGDILGGGEIDETYDDPENRWWWASLLVGGSVRFNRTDNVVGKATGQSLDVSAFLESFFTLGLNHHFLYTRLNAELGGTIDFENRPFVTTVDELDLEILYTYRVVDWFGPYVRFSFESNMAPANQLFKEPHNVIKHNSKGEVASVSENKMDVRLSPAFSPITLNAGAGGRFDLTLGTWFKMNARAGLAFRHVFTRDLYIVGDLDKETNTLYLDPISGSTQFGIEAAISLDLTPLQWFSIKTDFTILEPFNEGKKPILDLDLDAAIRLSSIASISYTLRLNYDIQMYNKVQLDQFIQLRFSYKIL